MLNPFSSQNMPFTVLRAPLPIFLSLLQKEIFPSSFPSSVTGTVCFCVACATNCSFSTASCFSRASSCCLYSTFLASVWDSAYFFITSACCLFISAMFARIFVYISAVDGVIIIEPIPDIKISLSRVYNSSYLNKNIHGKEIAF